MFGRVLFILCVTTASVARAEALPDRSPVTCAWSKFSPAEQERLRNAFSVDNSGPGRILLFAPPSTEQTQAAARGCNLLFDARQLTELSYALGAKAAEEVGRMGVTNRGLLKADIVDRALEKMHAGKRRIIGDFMACPTSASITIEWDRAVLAAMRRTHIKIMDGRTVALISLARYSIMSQEGHMRRIHGTAMSCDSFD